MEDIIKEFVNNICTNCKGECHKGITFIMNSSDAIRCVDYIKDETKIVKPKPILIVTAKKQEPVMKQLCEEENK